MLPYANCRSAGTSVLLAIAFGITELPLWGTSTRAGEMCVNVTGKTTCYFKGSQEPVNWSIARDICSSLYSTLPVIRTRDDQDAISSYLKSHTDNNSATWTAGRNYSHHNWTWINGEQLTEIAKVNASEQDEPYQEKDHAALDAYFNFIQLSAFEELPYICHDMDVRCKSSSDIDIIAKCLRIVDIRRTWYDARNHCLMTDWDLAVINDDIQVYLKKSTLNQSYWVGLRKQSWRWTLNDKAESKDEIKYTNWGSNKYSTDGEFVSFNAPDGRWIAIGKAEKLKVVCQGAPVLEESTTGVSQTPKVPAVCTSTVSEESTTGGSQTSIEQVALFAAVGAGIVIIICIIVIVFFVLRTKKRDIRQSKPSESSPQNNREEIDNNLINADVYTSVSKSFNAPVSISDDIGGVYAEVNMSTLNHSEVEATNQQPGILYASLDFKEDPTTLDPDQKPDHAAASVKVGPLGDVYAIPYGKRHEATSSYKGSDSQPVKFSQEGEVFYANLETETLYKKETPEDHGQPS